MAIWKEFGCLLLMLISGLFFCCPLAALVYFTYQTIIRSVAFCSLWIDVPGRLLIFMTCYYIASLCGLFPLPRRYLLNSFIQPFNVWSLESWRRLFRNFLFVMPSLTLRIRHQRNAEAVQNNPEIPLMQESNQECFCDRAPNSSTEPINIAYPASYVAPVFVSNREITPKNESPEINRDIDGSILSISSSASDIVVPIMKWKSSKRHYLSEASNRESESPERRSFVPSKYRKKYSEVKWTEGAAANVLTSALRNRSVVPAAKERSAIFEPDKTTATIDERFKSARQERPRPTKKKPKDHTSNAVVSKPNDRGFDHSTKFAPIEKAVESQAPVPDDHTIVPVGSERRSSEKYLALNDEENLVTRQQNRSKSGYKLQTVDEQFRLFTRKELPPRINDQSRTVEKNQPEAAATGNDRESTIKEHNSEAALNFPRFPWRFFRHPGGIPAGANKLHRRNVEFEKHEMEKYSIRQKRDLTKLARSLLASLRENRVTETQLPRSSENINLIMRSPFQTKSVSTTAAKNSKEQSEIACATESIINIDDVRQTSNPFNVTLTKEVENTNIGHATNQRRPLPSRKFQITRKISSRTQNAKINYSSIQKDSRQRTRSEPGPSNLCEFKQDPEKVDLLTPVNEDADSKSYKTEIADLKRRLKRVGQSSIQINTRFISAALDSNHDKKTDVRIPDVNGDDTTETSVSTKPSEVDADKKPDVEISIDSLMSKSKDDGNPHLEHSKNE